MDEIELIGFHGETPVEVHEVQATDINGKPFTFLAPGKPLLDTAMLFSFFSEGALHEVSITLEEMRALQRVARAQLELEKRRGRNG